MEFQLTLQVHEEDGGVWAEVAELPGCFASGSDLDELLEAMNEAISLYLDDNPEAQNKLAEMARGQERVKVVDFAARASARRGAQRLKVDDVHATVRFDDLIEA